MSADGGILDLTGPHSSATFLRRLHGLQPTDAKAELEHQEELWRRDGTIEAARRLALASRRQEDAATTLARIKELLVVYPDDPLLLSIESESLTDIEDPSTALARARRAARIAPDLAAPWVAMARALLASGRPDDALTACLSGCRAEPRNAAPGALLAEIAAKAGLTAADLKQRMDALPSSVTAGGLFAEALLAGDTELADALALVEACLGMALPDAELYRVAAHLQERNGHLDRAFEYLEKALALAPSNTALFEKARLLIELDRHRDAAELCDRLLAAGTELDAAFACQRAKAAVNLGEHALARRLISRHEQEMFSQPGMGRMMLGVEVYCEDEPARFLDHARQIVAASRHQGPPHLPLFIPYEHGVTSGQRPRIGLLSNNFSAHPVSFLTLAGFERLAEAGFDIICFETHDQKTDPWKSRFQVLAKEWHDLSGLDDTKAAQIIATSGVDILFDLQGFSRKAKPEILRRKPAPVIVKWVGMQAMSSGLPEMDYFLSDRIETPAGYDSFYTEKLLRLDRSYVAFEPPDVSRLPSTPPCLQQGFVTFGSFNNIQKVTPEALDAWARVLHGVPDARLLVKAPQLSEPAAVDALSQALNRRGIRAERLMFMGRSTRDGQLAAIASVDIALDPFPYSGGVCTLEALTVGVPVVALAGRSFAARHSASHLTWSGAPELVASSVESYVEIAIRLARDPDRLAAYRKTLPEGLVRPGGPADIAGFAQQMTTVLEALGREAKDIRARRPVIRVVTTASRVTQDSAAVIDRAFEITQGQFSPSWAMPKDTLGVILDHCATLKPRTIIEFGSGVSSVAFLLASERLGLSRLISFEHDPDWADRVRGWASAIGKQDLLDLRLRSLAPKTWGGLTGMFYDLNDEDLLLQGECLIIDGPPSGNAERAEHRRAMAGLAIERCVRPGGLVFLEDANRSWETDAYGRWVERGLFGEASLVKVGRGLFRGRMPSAPCRAPSG